MSNTNICEYCKMEEGWCMCEEGSKDKQIRQLKRDLDDSCVTNRESFLCRSKEQGLSDLEVG